MINDKKIRAYALKNAIAHEGKAQSGAVISSLFHEGLKKEDVKKYIKDINKVLSEINKLSIGEQEKEFERLEKLTSERETREGLEELPGAKEGKVIMRFRPAPSGPLHIGNVLGAGLPNSLYAKRYHGKFYVIIDDTNPEEVLADSYDSIKKDCDWILGNVYKYINSSDRMDIYYKYAEALIKKDEAYVCTCPSERFKKYSEALKECPCRKNSIEQNTERWKKMMDKKGFKEGDAVLRFKSSMQNPNPAMRDFPLARINLKKHPKQGNKYRVWPLMNLVVAVDDMELNMTHIIRGKDHRDNAERQKMIFNVFGKKFPWTFFIGRIKFADLILSKRKINAAIKSGEFSGAEDARLPTIASLRKRGYKPEAFAKFVEQRGLTEVDKVMDSKDFFMVIDNFSKKQL
ncbi:MAG TPA: glutamate--tRNA ligase family protein [Candidatus Omnitrophota bacterium]|nr:glutamate--tRNA ligase family protein [Candidatus Omnitrophota bacterium]